MRIGLLVAAGVALIGFLAIAVVLPQMEGGESRDAAAVLVSGTNAAKTEVGAAAEKAGNLAGAGANIKIAPRATRNTANSSGSSSPAASSAAGTKRMQSKSR